MQMLFFSLLSRRMRAYAYMRIFASATPAKDNRFEFVMRSCANKVARGGRRFRITFIGEIPSASRILSRPCAIDVSRSRFSNGARRHFLSRRKKQKQDQTSPPHDGSGWWRRRWRCSTQQDSLPGIIFRSREVWARARSERVGSRGIAETSS